MSPSTLPLLRLGAATLFGTLLLAGGASQSTPLVWKPTSSLAEGVGPLNLLAFNGQKIAVLPFTDSRKDPGTLGENQEKDAPRLVTTPDPVPPFIRAHVFQLLKEMGLPMTEKAEEATVVLSGELLRFDVVEKETYQGEFRAMVEVRAGDHPLWKGLVLGRATRFGRSYKLENYHETLSDSLINGVSRLLTDAAFLGALAQKPPAATAPAAPAAH